MKVPGILKNKYVFYALAALAVLNVVGYVSVQAWECLALFSLTAYSAHCYCNNKACAILAALFVANFVFGCGRVKAGMEDMLKSAEDHMADVVAAADKASEKAETEGMREGAETCSATAKQHCTDTSSPSCSDVNGTWTPGSCNDSSKKKQDDCTGNYQVNGVDTPRQWDATSGGTCA